MIDRIQRLAVAAASGLVVFAPVSALAADNQASFRITAVVQPFCQITIESGQESALVENGEARFGAVKELCNTRNGYSVRAEFMNLQGGRLRAGTDIMPIAVDGGVDFGSTRPALRVRDWTVFDLAEQAQQRIYMKVSISPL